MFTEEEIQAWTAKHGRVKHVSYNGTDIVFRAPTAAECDQHAMAIEEGGTQKAFADRMLSQQLVIACGETREPLEARQAWLALLARYPYAWRSAAVGGAMSKLTGVVQDIEVKSDGSTSPPNGSPQTITRGA